MSLRETNCCKQIETIYPSDIAIIITSYLLEKEERFKRSWHYDGLGAYISIIDGDIYVGDHAFTIDGSRLPNHKIPIRSSSVHDDKKIYVANYSDCELLILDKQTKMQLSSVRLSYCPWGIAILNEHIYVTDESEGVVCRYDTKGDFLLKWFVGGFVTSIISYDGSLFVLTDNRICTEIVRYSALGIMENRILAPACWCMTICEDKIFASNYNDGVTVCEIDGTIARKIDIDKARDIAAWDNNIIIRTHDEIIVYCMEYP